MALFTFFAALGSLAATPDAPASTTSATAFQPIIVMEDQFATPRRLDDLRGEVVVLVFSDRGGANSSRDLGLKLHVHFHPTARGQSPAIAAKAPVTPIPGWPGSLPTPDAKVIAIAVIGDVPEALKPMIRYRFRQVSPEGVIWLDFFDSMRKQFQVVPDMPNVAVLDKSGRVRYTASGIISGRKYDQLVAVVDGLRREPPPARLSPQQSPGNFRPTAQGPATPRLGQRPSPSRAN